MGEEKPSTPRMEAKALDREVSRGQEEPGELSKDGAPRRVPTSTNAPRGPASDTPLSWVPFC